MKTRSITEVAKSFLNEEIPKDGIICDFTMGGGHDTLYLSDLVPEGKVYAFDIQPLRWNAPGSVWRRQADAPMSS